METCKHEPPLLVLHTATRIEERQAHRIPLSLGPLVLLCPKCNRILPNPLGIENCATLPSNPNLAHNPPKRGPGRPKGSKNKPKDEKKTN